MIGCQGKIETVIGCRWLMFEVLEAVMVYCSELWHVQSAHPDFLHLIKVGVPPVKIQFKIQHKVYVVGSNTP